MTNVDSNRPTLNCRFEILESSFATGINNDYPILILLNAKII